MRAFLILIAISAISAIYIEQNRSSDRHRSKSLLSNQHHRYETISRHHSDHHYQGRNRKSDDDSEEEIRSHNTSKHANNWHEKKEDNHAHEKKEDNHSHEKTEDNHSHEKKRANHSPEKKHSEKDAKDKVQEHQVKPLYDADYFFYYEDKASNVKYYYPKSLLKVEDISKTELELFNSIGGYEGLVKLVGILVHEHLLLNEKMKNECDLLGASLAKDLVDFFVRVAANDRYEFNGLKKAFEQSNLLKRINFKEFIIMVILSAEKLNITSNCIQQLTDKLDYIRDHASYA